MNDSVLNPKKETAFSIKKKLPIHFQKFGLGIKLSINQRIRNNNPYERYDISTDEINDANKQNLSKVSFDYFLLSARILMRRSTIRTRLNSTGGTFKSTLSEIRLG